MSAPTSTSWRRRLAKLEAALPRSLPGAPYWLNAFEVIGVGLGLAAREPDFPAALAAYRGLRRPYGTGEAVRRHDHLWELGRRALDGVPACSVAEFAGLAAWLAANGAGLPGGAGWPPAIDVGDGTAVTLPDLAWRVGKGPTAAGSGQVAETIRKLRARYPDRAAAESAQGERERTSPPPRRSASVVRDDSDFDAAGAAEPPRPIEPGGS